jgi:hypothetical protein
LNWREKNVRIRQETGFPERESTSLLFQMEGPVELALRIRIPYWATRGEAVKVNGKPLRVEASPSSYLEIRRTWKDGDRVDLDLPMSLHAQPMPDDKTLMAFLYGPLVLAGELGGEGLTDENTHTTQNWYRYPNPAEAPHFLVDSNDLEDWIKPVPGEPLRFQTRGAGRPRDVTLVPYHKLFDQRYAVYWHVYRKGSPEHRDMLAREEARKRRLARTVDSVKIGDPASERAHNLKHQNSQAGSHLGRSWRHAVNGWFSYDLEVPPDQPVSLGCTYWGDDVGTRTFDVLVDSEKVATQTLNRNRPGRFFEVEYRIPPRLIRGKKKVTVKFQAHPNNTAGGVFGCALLKDQQ